MIKVLILNSKVSPKKYFRLKGLDMEVTFGKLEVDAPLEVVGKVIRPDGVEVPLYSPDIVEYIRGIIEPNQYNYVLWCYPAEQYPQNQTTGGKSYAYPHVYIGTELATIRMDGNDEHYMVHELHHLFCYHLNKLGYPTNDVMDTIMVNGKYEHYYKDNDRDAPDSNHSVTYASIKPYAAFLDDFAPIMKNGLKSPWVRQLQLKLLELGYWSISTDGKFGNNTERIVKEIQTKKGLLVDGIVGPKTLSALETKKNFKSK